jgi:hypothetical protein
MTGNFRTVCKLVVVAADGRRSSLWRAWTGGQGRPPKDDIYLAPAKKIKEFKISLHRDNMAQYGLSESMRARIRPGDRHAPLRWEMGMSEIIPGWRPAYMLRFPEQELETLPPVSDEVIQIKSASPGGEVVVLVLIGKPGAVLASDTVGEIISLLDREDGGHVALVAFRGPFNADLLSGLTARASQSSWQLPTLVSDPEPFGWVVHNHNGTRVSTEFSSTKHPVGASAVTLRGFTGEVLSIEDCPAEVQHMDSGCAVLICGSDGHELYVDTRARCSHEHLLSDAMDLVGTYEKGEIDSHWASLRDGRKQTTIATQRVLEDKGISSWGRGPWSSY